MDSGLEEDVAKENYRINTTPIAELTGSHKLIFKYVPSGLSGNDYTFINIGGLL